jgi:outer membrane protein insertion porin family
MMKLSLRIIFMAGLGLAIPLNAAEMRVGTVQIRMQGGQPVSLDAVRSRICLREGEIFRPELNDDSIRALHATNLFDHIEVITDGDEVGNNTINVIYVLYPKQRIGQVRFVGNHHMSAKKLFGTVKTVDGSFFDWPQVQKDIDAVAKFYRNHGYVDIAVTSRSEPIAEGNPDLCYVIDEGSRMPIGEISFEGNASVGSGTLRRQMSLRPHRILSILDGSGYYLPDRMEADVEKLSAYYRERGFLDVAIPIDGVILRRDANKSLAIQIHIVEGQRFRIGKVTFSGNELYTSDELERLLRIHERDYFSANAVDAAVESIRNFYGQRGHMDSYAIAQRRANIAQNSIDINFSIHESPPCEVGLVRIQGNVKTRNRVILRELSLFPGERFDLIKLRNSENRLRETRYFNVVTIGSDDEAGTGRRDVNITVEEAQTGKFAMGGAISSVDNVIGYMEFAQSNFDLGNRRSAFQGGGQKFRTRVEIGTRTSQAQVFFEEPWLFQREIALGGEMFSSHSEYKKDDHNYSGASYNERHRGFEGYIRKRVVGLLEGRTYYRLDRAKIYDIGPDAPEPLIWEALAGSRWISRVGVQLQRDTRDSLLYPTVGNKMVMDVNYAGIGGDVHYLGTELQIGQWVSLSRHREQTIAFFGKFASIRPFRHTLLPYFDRKFLGGTGDMRGFEFHAVGPRDRKGEPFGAQSYIYGCSEYSFRVANPLRVAVFGEFAHIGREWMRLNSPLYVDAGVELRLFVMGSPLRLIFGYPLHGDAYYAHRLQFNFTFGTVF